MRHKKVYLPNGGVRLFCGKKELYTKKHDVNWRIVNCRFCGMDVATIGSSPETTRIYEGDTVPSGLEIFKVLLKEVGFSKAFLESI